MAEPAKKIQLEDIREAVLKLEPEERVKLAQELLVSVRRGQQVGLGTRLAAIGPWEGIEMDELLRILKDGRESGGSAPPPDMP